MLPSTQCNSFVFGLTLVGCSMWLMKPKHSNFWLKFKLYWGMVRITVFLSILTRFLKLKSCFSTIFVGSVCNSVMLKRVSFNDPDIGLLVCNKYFVVNSQQDGQLPPAYLAPSHYGRDAFLKYESFFPQKRCFLIRFSIFPATDFFWFFSQTTWKSGLKRHFQTTPFDTHWKKFCYF